MIDPSYFRALVAAGLVMAGGAAVASSNAPELTADAVSSASHDTAGLRGEAAPAPDEAAPGTSHPGEVTIAMIMPPDESDVLSAARIVANGLIAAGRTHVPPVRILTIEAPGSVGVAEQVDAAIMNGADVIVGPIERERVASLCGTKPLPIPVVSLNSSVCRDVPANLYMMGLSSEKEASFVAKAALESIPEEKREGLRVALLSTPGAWEEKIVSAYEAVLRAEGVPFERFAVSPDRITEFQKTFAPVLSEEDAERFAAERRSILGDASLSQKARTNALKALESAKRARTAVSEPPYALALLAMDNRSASLIRNTLPLKMSVWGTSSVNPGDADTSSMAMTLGYDLNGVHFADSPLVAKYTEEGFKAKFNTPQPYSPAARRLFALGVDAFDVADRVARGSVSFRFRGETGGVSLDAKASPYVERVPDRFVVEDGRLVDVDMTPEEKAAREAVPSEASDASGAPADGAAAGDGAAPEGNAPAVLENLPKAQEHLDQQAPLDVAPVILTPAAHAN